MAELWLHPVLPFAVAALVAWFAPSRIGATVMVAAPLVAFVQIVRLDAGMSVPMTYASFELEVMRVDALSIPFAWVFALAALIAGLYGLSNMGSRERASALSYVAAAMGVVLAGDLLTLFVFWEIKAVTSTFLILHHRGANSARAGLRYLFVHLVGGKLLLAGVLLHYARTGSLAFESMALDAATSLVLVAFLLSAAVPPLHAWLADAYPEASVAGTVFLSAFTTKAAIYALARGFPGTQSLILLGVIMALYGVLFAMLQNDTRRLLAYHIVSQVGFMVAAIGIGTELAINGAVAHAFAHILYKGLLLMGAGAVLHATGRSRMSELGGIARRMRGVLVLYMVGAVSISSVPLFSGFVSKELIVDAAYRSDLIWLVLLLKIASVGTFLSTALKLPYGAFFGKEGAGPATNDGHRITVAALPASMYLAMGIGAAVNVVIGLYPAVLYDLMPYVVDYTPYSLGKVLEKSQTLLFTALVFWLLHDRLQAKAKITVDTDWLYRGLPVRLGARGTGEQAPTAEVHPDPEDHASPRTLVALRRQATAVFEPSDSSIVPTWTLGAVILLTSVIILVASLTP